MEDPGDLVSQEQLVVEHSPPDIAVVAAAAEQLRAENAALRAQLEALQGTHTIAHVAPSAPPEKPTEEVTFAGPNPAWARGRASRAAASDQRAIAAARQQCSDRSHSPPSCEAETPPPPPPPQPVTVSVPPPEFASDAAALLWRGPRPDRCTSTVECAPWAVTCGGRALLGCPIFTAVLGAIVCLAVSASIAGGMRSSSSFYNTRQPNARLGTALLSASSAVLASWSSPTTRGLTFFADSTSVICYYNSDVYQASCDNWGASMLLPVTAWEGGAQLAAAGNALRVGAGITCALLAVTALSHAAAEDWTEPFSRLSTFPALSPAAISLGRALLAAAALVGVGAPYVQLTAARTAFFSTGQYIDAGAGATTLALTAAACVAAGVCALLHAGKVIAALCCDDYGGEGSWAQQLCCCCFRGYSPAAAAAVAASAASTATSTSAADDDHGRDELSMWTSPATAARRAHTSGFRWCVIFLAALFATALSLATVVTFNTPKTPRTLNYLDVWWAPSGSSNSPRSCIASLAVDTSWRVTCVQPKGSGSCCSGLGFTGSGGKALADTPCGADLEGQVRALVTVAAIIFAHSLLSLALCTCTTAWHDAEAKSGGALTPFRVCGVQYCCCHTSMPCELRPWPRVNALFLLLSGCGTAMGGMQWSRYNTALATWMDCQAPFPLDASNTFTWAAHDTLALAPVVLGWLSVGTILHAAPLAVAVCVTLVMGVRAGGERCARVFADARRSSSGGGAVLHTSSSATSNSNVGAAVASAIGSAAAAAVRGCGGAAGGGRNGRSFALLHEEDGAE